MHMYNASEVEGHMRAVHTYATKPMHGSGSVRRMHGGPEKLGRARRT